MLYDWFAAETSNISVQKIRLLPGNDARWDAWKQQARISSTPGKSGCEQLSVCRNPVTESEKLNHFCTKRKGLEVE